MKWARGAVVGRGSFATVSLAVTDNNTLIAAKSAEVSTSSLLQHEESILMDLQGCRQIVSCFGHDVTAETAGRQLYNLFLEYVPGGSLADLLRSRHSGRLPESSVRRFATSMLEGLRFIHGHGYVHCDVKPQNILVCPNGEVKIADFGLALRSCEGTETECSVRGTPLYMSPESVARKEFKTPMDIWALGCVVAEMVTGRPAWGESKGGNDFWAVMMRIGFGEELPEIPAGLSAEGRDFLKRCFVREPESRWTADMLLEHAFVASAAAELGDDGALGACEAGDHDQRLSPRSVFGFSRGDESCTSSEFDDGGDRIGLWGSDQPPLPESWGCESCEGWIRVRELDAASSLDHLIAARDRMAILATDEAPDWCRSSRLSNDGWITVRDGCENECQECCNCLNLKECKYVGCC